MSPKQRKAWRSRKPWLGYVGGLGSGKTWFGSRWMLFTRALRYIGAHLVTAGSYRQLIDAVLPALLSAVDEYKIRHTWRKSDMELTLGNGSIIRCRSMETADRLRGAEYLSGWADEIREATEEQVKVVRARVRAPTYVNATLRRLWTTTPKGFDHTWEEFVKRATRRTHDLVQRTDQAK